jgi:ADP-ribose pyrophosphatase
LTELSRYRGAFLEMVTEEVQLPNGKTATLDLIRHPGASAVVPFLDSEHVLLIRQHRHAAGGTIYEVPAGKLEPGEAPETCALRELEEETGQRAGRIEALASILTTPGFTDERIHLFAAFDLEAVPTRLDPDEIIEVVPMSFEEALSLVWSGELSDAKSALALIHAGRLLGRIRTDFPTTGAG